jgi:hypothetical protein
MGVSTQKSTFSRGVPQSNFAATQFPMATGKT